METYWWIAIGLAMLVISSAGFYWARRPFGKAARRHRLSRAKELFHREREWLEARYITVAGASGKPRGLRWADCEFDDPVAYARDRKTGDLAAFVTVTIAFEAIEGGGMEQVEAVGNLRAATAVFRYTAGKWQTDGRTIFNLSPQEAIAYFQNELEPIADNGPEKAITG